MVNDPERPIEKLLRECAETRRGRGELPAALHPVNRKLLQDEVKRVFGGAEPERPRSRISALGTLRNWGVALGGLAVVIVITILVWPGTKPPEQMQLLARRDEPAPSAPAPKAKPSEPAPLSVASAPASAKEEPSLGLAAPKPGALLKLDSAALKDESRAQQDHLTTLASADQTSRAALNLPQGKAPETLFRRQSADVADKNSVSVARQAFETSGRKAAGGAAATSVAAQPSGSILAAFEVEQNGTELRIIDQDGSIYRGKVEPVQNSAAPRLEQAARMASRSATKQLAQRGLVEAYDRAPVPASPVQQNYAFRVAGTNMSLKQQVLFSGQLTLLSNVAGNLPPPATPALATNSLAPLSGMQQLLLPDYQILGQAVVGDQPEIQIIAQPASK